MFIILKTKQRKNSSKYIENCLSDYTQIETKMNEATKNSKNIHKCMSKFLIKKTKYANTSRNMQFSLQNFSIILSIKLQFYRKIEYQLTPIGRGTDRPINHFIKYLR